MLAAHRQQLALSQSEYAALLGVSQPYLSLLESNVRPLTPKLLEKLSQRFKPTDLPLELSETELDDDTLANTLGALGYPGFAHLTHAPKLNPAVLVLECLRKANLDVRVLEALPWFLGHYEDLNLEWLTSQAKLRNLQNRVAFLSALSNEVHPRPHLNRLLTKLEPARLAAEQTLANDKMPATLRAWMRQERTPLAAHWNVLTKLDTSSVARWMKPHAH